MKLEINSMKKTENFTNTWNLSDMLPNNQWIKEEIKRDIKKDLEMNKNESTTYQHLWNIAKPLVLRGDFIGINA